MSETHKTAETPQNSDSTTTTATTSLPAGQLSTLTLKQELSQLPSWAKAVAAMLTVYVISVSIMRFSQCLNPWVAETDWKQWVWQYWRYNIPGAFPEGHPITDYTFNAQPPLYHLAMSTLSRVFRPVVAANIVNWVAWTLALGACVATLRRRASLLVGLVVAALFVHDDVLHRISMGGYPRSFGPPLVMLFLAAWLNGRHYLTCLVLICGAALYPSVCVPCGLAYGLWTAATAPRTSLKAWLRPNVEVVATGGLVGFLALLQSFTAPKWWGPVVSAKDAGIALTSQGRTQWLPLGPFWPGVFGYFKEPWNFSGATSKMVPWSHDTAQTLGMSAAVVTAIVGVVFALKNKQRQLPVPAQMFLIFGCAVFSFYLAREFAFKLYLPRRMVQHTLPSILFVTLPLLYFTTGMAIWQNRLRATVFVLLGLLVPTLVLCGDGYGASGYRSYAKNEKLYRWIEKNTKVQDQFGGYYRILDEIPFFAARQVYVNWKMAHPFRQGFYDEIDRRTVAMYDAYFATDLHQLQSFMRDKDVAWFVVNDGLFDKLEGGDSQLFEPTRGKILKSIFNPRRGRFVLKDPPKEIVAFRQGSIRVLSRDKLDRYLRDHPEAAPATTTPDDGGADDRGGAGDEADSGKGKEAGDD